MRRVRYSIVGVFLGLMFVSSSLFARVIIEDVHISKDIDRKEHMPIDIVDEMPNSSKQIALSARVRNLPRDKKIRVVWYSYNDKHGKVKMRDVWIRPDDHNFLYHIIHFRELIRVGKYFVDIVVNNRLVKSKSFVTYESRSRSAIKWEKLNTKGVKLFNKHRYDEAIEIFKDANKVLKQDDSVDYRNILRTLNNMALSHLLNKNKKTSKVFLKKANSVAKDHDLLNELTFAHTLSIEASLNFREDNYKKAIEYYTKSLEISDRYPEVSCKKYIINRRDALYNTYQKQKDYDNARFILQEIIECYKKDAPIAVLRLVQISDTYMAQKRYKMAEKYLDRVYKILKREKKPNKRLIYAMMQKMSQLYIETKRYKRAKIVTDRLIKKSKELYGAKSMQTIDALQKLARIYSETDDPKRAKIVEKNIDRLYAKLIKSKSCFDMTKSDDDFLYAKVYKRYGELDSDVLSSYHIKRYIDDEHRISLISPLGWKSKDKDMYIMYLQHRDESGNNVRYTLREIPKFWKNDKSQNYKKLIQKISSDIDNMLIESIKGMGDSIMQIIPLKIYKRGRYIIGHTLTHQKGNIGRYYGNTFIFDGKNIYLLSTVTSNRDLLLGEFLSSIAMKSFCSDVSVATPKDIDGVTQKVKELERNLSNLETRHRGNRSDRV